jgi:hypothetical protein
MQGASCHVQRWRKRKPRRSSLGIRNTLWPRGFILIRRYTRGVGESTRSDYRCIPPSVVSQQGLDNLPVLVIDNWSSTPRPPMPGWDRHAPSAQNRRDTTDRQRRNIPERPIWQVSIFVTSLPKACWGSRPRPNAHLRRGPGSAGRESPARYWGSGPHPAAH